MALLRGIRERVIAIFFRRRVEQEMEQEFEFHLENAIKRNLARGMQPDEARRLAFRDFGGIERRKEQTRDEQGVRLLIGFGQNLHYAIRHLIKSPGFTFVAITVMGLGIGANTAIFSLINSILFRPLPIEESSEVVRIYTLDPETGRTGWNSYPDYQNIRERSEAFSAVAAISDILPFSVITGEGAKTVLSEVHSASLFTVLGIRPFMGRTFRPEEDLPGAAEAVVIINYSTWKKRHSSTPDIIGKTIKLNGYPVTVVGIGPPEFKGMFVGVHTEYWVPWGTAALIYTRYTHLDERDSRSCNIMGRLRNGVGFEGAQISLDIIMASLAEEYPETNADRRPIVFMADTVRMDPFFDQALYPLSGFLMTVVVLVLLVACSNLAGFLLQLYFFHCLEYSPWCWPALDYTELLRSRSPRVPESLASGPRWVRIPHVY